MKVILLQNVKKLGDLGDQVNVANGYFENFLLPQGLAQKATPQIIAWSEKIISERVAQKAEITKKAKEYAEKIEKATLSFTRKTTKDGKKLFGAIAEKDIMDEIEKKLKIALEKKQIRMVKHIKEVGNSVVTIHLADDVSAELKVEVKAEK